MGKNSIIVLIIMVFVMGLAQFTSISFACDELGPEEIELNAAGKRPAVFNHKGHQDKFYCTDCHHPDLIGGACEELRCDNCHYIDEGEGNGKNDDISYPIDDLDTWKEIGHGLCKDCHSAYRDSGAPTRCVSCHPK